METDFQIQKGVGSRAEQLSKFEEVWGYYVGTGSGALLSEEAASLLYKMTKWRVAVRGWGFENAEDIVGFSYLEIDRGQQALPEKEVEALKTRARSLSDMAKGLKVVPWEGRSERVWQK